MNCYQEIQLISDTKEIPISFLWSKVYMRLHLALAQEKEKRGKGIFAVSFPQYQAHTLGNILRIFAETREDLETLNMKHVLQHLQEYVHITGVRDIQKQHGWAIYKRYQPDGTVQRKARRYSRRHRVSYEEACHILKSKPRKTVPYIQLRSASSQQTFSLFIQRIETNEKQGQSFSAYGLSQNATVPEF